MVPVVPLRLLLVLVCLGGLVVAPSSQAALGFRIDVVAPEVVVVGDTVQVNGSYHNGLVPAPDRPVWLMHGDRRLAASTTSLEGDFSFTLSWPVAGTGTFHVVGDAFSALETVGPPFDVLGLDAPAAPPDDVAVVDRQWGAVEVRWDPGVPWPGSEPQEWRVERAPDGTEDWRSVGTVAAEVTALQDPVETGTWYQYRVRGWNLVGEGAAAGVVHRTEGPNDTADSPGMLGVDMGDSWRRAVLSWPSDERLGHEAETWQVFRRPASVETPWVLIGEVARPGTTYEDRIEDPGEYEYAVRGWNAHGAGPHVNTSFVFALPGADWVGVKVEFVRICTDGPEGPECRHLRNGGRLSTDDGQWVTSMSSLVSFWVLDGHRGVPEAPVELRGELWLPCDDGGCRSAGQVRPGETGMDGEGLAVFPFGPFVDPEGECLPVEARATVMYRSLTQTESIFFDVCG